MEELSLIAGFYSSLMKWVVVTISARSSSGSKHGGGLKKPQMANEA